MTKLEKPKMDDEYITQNDIVQRYLQNKLTPEETVEFEEFILDKPELLERLELDMVLVETLPKVSETVKSTNRAAIRWWTPIFSHVTVFSHVTTIAACTALIAVLWFRTPDPTNNSGFSPNIVYLENYRSALNEFNLAFAKNEEFKVIVITIPPNSGDEFELKIEDRTGKPIVLEHLKTNNSKEVTFLLYQYLISDSDYRLVLRDNNTVVADFNLKVDRN